MTDPDNKGAADPPPHGSVVAGAQSAGTTTLLRHCLAGLTPSELRTASAVRSPLQGSSGARS